MREGRKIIHHKIQKEVGFTLIALSVLSCFANVLDPLLANKPFDLSFFIQSSYASLIAIPFLILTSFINTNFFRLLQASFILIVGLVLIVFDGPKNFYGVFIVAMSLLLFLRFSLVKEVHTIKMVIAFGILLLIAIVIHTVVISSIPTLFYIKYVAFFLACLAVFFFCFETQIKHLLHSNKTLQDKVNELEPISVLGKKVSSIIHSLKNDVQAINSLSQMISYSQQTEDSKKYNDKIATRLSTMGSKITSILYLSADGQNTDNEQLDITKTLQGIYYLYLGENIYDRGITTKFDMSNLPQVYAWGSKSDLNMLLENVISNALEAIQDSKNPAEHKTDYITMILDKEGFSIANTGGVMKSCENCPILDCTNGCPVYTKRGHTTKWYGSGFGMATMFEIAKSFKWKMKVLTNQEDGSTTYSWKF